jgi:DNA mismatch repair protein MutL
VTDVDELTELDEATVERIAAGEVVERPASVVKELVENSLDAGASRVEVAVERGGKDLVRVRDDGEGMTEPAVRTAVRSHTTSKIRDAADLDAGVDTLGFRGEALSTIGAVSRLSVRTKPPGADAGTELRVAGGDVVAVEPTGCPEGTTVEVTDLFYNTPAREKYLKQDRTEFGRVNDVVTKYALARPEVAVSLTHDGREVFATTGQGDRRSAILAVYGREVAAAMVPVDGGEGPPGDVEGPLDAVEGYVSDPETTRSSRDYVAVFVDGRYVQSDAAREAVVDAYGGQLAADRYPFAVLDLQLPPGEVDVNVHPRKLQVRFADEAAVREQVGTVVRETLLEEGLVRSSAPRGRSAPEETVVEPERLDERESERADATADTDATGGTTAGSDTRASGRADADADTPTPDSTAPRGSTPSSGRTTPDDDAPASGPGASTDDRTDDGDHSTDDRTDDGDHSTDDRTDDGRSTPDDGGRFEATEQRTLDGEGATVEREYDALPSLRVLGQYDDTYVVAARADGRGRAPPHAADERVNYERLQERFAGDTTTQSLAEPERVELTARESELFETCEEALARLGFYAERVDDRTVEVTTVPAVVAEAGGPEVVRDVLADLGAGERAADGTVEAVADELLADMACYPAVTGNTSLTEGSVVDLLAALDDCENPWACPHGRPTVVQFDHDEVADRFERDYPGH